MSMTEQEKDIVAKASIPMVIANGFRWIFMVVALMTVLFVFFGNKLWSGTQWYEAFMDKVYSFLFWDIALLVLCNIVRFIFVVRYNRIVKKL